ncbi:MAG: FAD-dependent oxidoreductase [Candidatus Omnitrophica bacterium]|nr:FAD-dependent oxidoreductase [Candidatus Omnitrophota bacterium]MCM8827197.1 FAD-dependent oxidoreductase [Candidatus Omnitrophota bacterium]
MGKKRILIIGGGLAGLTLGYFLKNKGIRSFIFEKEKNYGGLCSSSKLDGFTFDFSGHLLHFRRQSTLYLVKKLLGRNLKEIRRKAYVYFGGQFIPYPFQANLCYLPKKVYRECLNDFIDAQKDNYGKIYNGNFLEWINQKFGSGIANNFLIPYNVKFWKVPLDELVYKGIDRYIYVPSLREVISDSCKNEPVGYNAFFFYPKKGGIEELVKAFAMNIDHVYTDCEVKEVDISTRKIMFKNGNKEKFDILVSTIPLPELNKIIMGLPKNITSLFKKLRWVSIYNLNLGLNRKIFPRWHWIYYHQKELPFFRIGFYHNFSSNLVPSSKGSLYIEISYNSDNPIDKKNIISIVNNSLKSIGFWEKGLDICSVDIKDIKYGYPICDINYQRVRGEIINYFTKKNIILCGRYGSWQYLSMEDTIFESNKVAELIYKYM